MSTEPAIEQPTAVVAGRLASLDVLRGIAVLLVFGRHLGFYRWSWHLPYRIPEFLLYWERVGWIGVDLFFVLSGFLVAGLLFHEQRRHGTVRYGRFLIRRGLKIYPAFYAFMLFTVIWSWRHGGVPIKDILSELLFVQNYVSPFWNHTWSLAVEEHFYLLLALLLMLLSYTRRDSSEPFRWVPAIWLIIALAVPAARLWTTSARPFKYQTHLFATHLRIDSLMFGVLLAFLFHYHGDRLARVVMPLRVPLLIASVALLSSAFRFELDKSPFLYTRGFTLIYLGFGALLLVFVHTSPTRNRVLEVIGWPLRVVGFHSYSIYLWHVAVVAWGIPAWREWMGWLGKSEREPLDHYLWGLAVYLIGAVLVGVVFARCIETPFLALRDRWFPSRSGSPVRR